MSYTDRFRPLAAKLFDAKATAATVTVAGKRTTDRITGEVTQAGSSTKTVMAVLGARRIAADDGTIRIQSIVKLNGSVKAGDTLTMGSNTYVIGDVEELAPDGGTPLMWTAVLK